MFGDKNSKFCSHLFLRNDWRKPHPDILKTVRGDRISVKLKNFHKNWQHCELANISIFKISLIDPPIDVFDGGMGLVGII